MVIIEGCYLHSEFLQKSLCFSRAGPTAGGTLEVPCVRVQNMVTSRGHLVHLHSLQCPPPSPPRAGHSTSACSGGAISACRGLASSLTNTCECVALASTALGVSQRPLTSVIIFTFSSLGSILAVMAAPYWQRTKMSGLWTSVEHLPYS